MTEETMGKKYVLKELEKQLILQLKLNTTLTEKYDALNDKWRRDMHIAGSAIGTFESYLQSRGEWDDIKKMKQIIDDNCPIKDVAEVWDEYWGHRCLWDEEPEEEDDQ